VPAPSSVAITPPPLPLAVLHTLAGGEVVCVDVVCVAPGARWGRAGAKTDFCCLSSVAVADAGPVARLLPDPSDRCVCAGDGGGGLNCPLLRRPHQ
jgi:hypothetical protein